MYVCMKVSTTDTLLTHREYKITNFNAKNTFKRIICLIFFLLVIRLSDNNNYDNNKLSIYFQCQSPN